MGNLGNFDANTVEPRSQFEPLPVGKYPAIITESEMKQTKSGEGEYLQLTFEIIGEQYKGRRIWARLNLKNKNATAVRIAESELSAICRSVGVMTPSDSSQLHNIPLQIDIGMEKNKETGDMQNRLKDYHPANGAPHSSPAIAAAITGSGTSAGTVNNPPKPPWAK